MFSLFLQPDDVYIVYLGAIWIFIDDLGQGLVDAVEKVEPKSARFIPRLPDCRTTYLQVETTSESSITVGHLPKRLMVAPKWGLMVAVKLRSAKLNFQIKLPSAKVMIFLLKSQKKAFGSGSLTSKAKLPSYVSHFEAHLLISIDAVSYDTRYGTHAQRSSWSAPGLQESLHENLQDLEITSKVTQA